MENKLTIMLVLGYFLICIILAVALDFYIKRKQAHTSESFSTAKNTMGVIAVFGLMVGNVLGGGYVVGTPGGIIANNLGYNWTVIGYIIGWALTVFFLRYYRAAGYKYGASTLGEVFKYFWSDRMQKVVSAMIFIAFAGALSGSMVAVSQIIRSMFGIGVVASYAITIALITFIALLGGMGGLARLNIVHVAFLALSVIVLAILSMNATEGGFPAAWEQFASMGKATFSGEIYSTTTILLMVVVQPFVCFVSALSISGTIGAKDLRTARTAQIGLPIFAIIFFACLNIVGICGNAWGLPGDNTLWYAAAEALGPVPAALASIGVLAATLSSAPSMVLMMGSIAIREFYLPSCKEPVSEQKKIVLTKIAIIICSVVFQILGVFSDDLIKIVSNAYSVWAVCGLALTISLVWKRPNEKSMFVSCLMGTIFIAIWVFAGFFVEGGNLFGIPTQAVALVSTVVILVAMTLTTTKPGISENYIRYAEARDALKAAEKAGEEGA